MSLDPDALQTVITRQGPVIRVVVAEAAGSVPREPGAAMLVWADGFEGTIGGGALEWEALDEARRRLAGPPDMADGARAYPLGPALAQCCGGRCTLAFERWDPSRIKDLDRETRLLARPLGGVVGAADAPLAIRGALRAARSKGEASVLFAPGDPPWLAESVAPARTPLWLWGAGHVGRAVVKVFEDLPFAIAWIDDAPERFPDAVPPHAERVITKTPARLAAHAPGDAAHLVMTYSHALDLEICHAVLRQGAFSRLGLIGSATKAARFRARLDALGHSDPAVSRLECPIGLRRDGEILGGKSPAEIAVSIAADHLAWRNRAKTRRPAADIGGPASEPKKTTARKAAP
ncbi:MAG: xanthine dehydrogenase accessory protein XdhC [Pseudomonadota bacterium]